MNYPWIAKTMAIWQKSQKFKKIKTPLFISLAQGQLLFCRRPDHRFHTIKEVQNAWHP